MSQLPSRPSNTRVILFIVILSFVCALVLSILASVLRGPQEKAKELDQDEQMLIAARIITHDGYFLLRNEEGKLTPAKHAGNGVLVPGTEDDFAESKDILEVYRTRLLPMLVDNQGNLTTFESAGIDEDQYLVKNKRTGYYKLPLKLIYEILPNPNTEDTKKPLGYIIPINGYGLWDAIYGYLGVEPDGITVIGTAWYDHKETPGLGANIAEKYWQSQFPGKQIFLSPDNETLNLKTAPLGITIVKGKVEEILGDTPKAKTAVDGMPGATLTGNGVQNAYRDVLKAYRPFFIKLHEQATSDNGG